MPLQAGAASPDKDMKSVDKEQDHCASYKCNNAEVKIICCKARKDAGNTQSILKRVQGCGKLEDQAEGHEPPKCQGANDAHLLKARQHVTQSQVN